LFTTALVEERSKTMYSMVVAAPAATVSFSVDEMLEIITCARRDA
jgi:hypothetical protein